MRLAALAVLVRIVVIALSVSVFALAAPTFGAAQTDPMIGDWKLNLAKSKYSPGPAPRSSALNVHAAGDGLMAMFDNVNAEGTAAHPMFTIVCNGQPQPVSGSAVTDAMSCRRPDPHSQTFTNMKGGRTTTNGTVTLSRDGRTMTISTKGTSANGQQIDNVAVYERQ